jgi:hypothetical protein
MIPSSDVSGGMPMRRMVVSWIALLSLAALGCATPTPSSTTLREATGTLNGVVVDQAGRPLSGAVVTVAPIDASTPQIALQSNTGGKFSAKLAPGRYRVLASLPGYRESPREEVVIAAGESTGLRVMLTAPAAPEVLPLGRG